MKQIQETPTHLIYLDYFEGQQVRIFKNKLTGEVGFNTDDVAKILGYRNETAMLNDPKVNDVLKQSYSETGKMPLMKIDDYNNNLN